MTRTPERLTRIALDAMGGDHGPAVTVPAALKAIEKDGVSISLVGDRAAIQTQLDEFDSQAKKLVRVVPAEAVVEENESPALAFRSKPRASIFVSAGIVKSGKADA